MFKSRTRFLAVMACLSVFLLCGTLAFCLETQNFGSNVNIQYVAPKGPFKYELNSTSTGFIVVGYTKNAGKYELPSTWTQDGKTLPVTEIGDRAFENETEFNYLNLPDTITRIGNFAFNGSNISSMTIPKNVKIIGNGAFNNCKNLLDLYYNAIDASIPDDSAGIMDGSGCRSSSSGNGETGFGIFIGDTVKNLPLAIISYTTIEPYVTSITFGKNIASCTPTKSKNVKGLNKINYWDLSQVIIKNEYIWKNFYTGNPDFGGDALMNHINGGFGFYLLTDVRDIYWSDFEELESNGVIEYDGDYDDVTEDGELYSCYWYNS